MLYPLACRTAIVGLLIGCATFADAQQPANAEQLESSAWWLNRAVDYAKQIEDDEARSQANYKLTYALTHEGDFARALQSASEVIKPQIRVYAFSRVAKFAHQREDKETCDKALQIAREVAIPAENISTNAHMVRLYFELDRPDEAVTFAAALQDRIQKRSTYQDVADEMAKEGRIDEALAIVRQHKPATQQDSARASIAVACARASRFDRAVELAEKVEKAKSRDAAYDKIAGELIRAGRLDQGKVIARRIQDERKRSDRLADHLSTAVKSKEGAKSIDTAMAEAATREEKVSVGMLKFAELVDNREIEKAEALIVSLVKTIQNSPREARVSKFGTFDDSLQIATVKAGYLETAKLLKDAGDDAGAKDRIAEVVAAARAIKPPSIGKSLLAAKLVQTQAALGDAEGAKASSSLFDTDLMLSNSKGDMAASLILSGKVDEGLKLAKRIDEKNYAHGARRVANALISMKRFDELAGYIAEIPDTGYDIRVFREIAKALVKSGNVSRLDLLLDSLPSDAARTRACLGAYDQLRPK